MGTAVGSATADPALSALKIGVTTREGVVELTGPAPEGVVRVDNRLVVPPPTNSVPQV